jgi:hypothetical protein
MDIERAVERAIEECGFLTSDVVAAFAESREYRREELLIVAGAGRYVVKAYQVASMVERVEQGGDYIRSVQIPTGHPLARRI